MSLLTKIKTWLNPKPSPQQPPYPETASKTDLPETNTLSPITPDTSTELLPELEPEAPTDISQIPNIDTITLRHETEFCGLMLAKTIEAQQNWLKNLEDALRGQNPSIYTTKLASDDRLSELGIWLYKNESILSPYSEYPILLDINKRFHECAGEVVRHHRAGRFADAILLLRRDLSLLAEEVQKSLIKLQEQVKAKGENICD